MLKEAIIGYINEFAKEYCEGLDPSQVNVSLWAGDLTLCDVHLKSTALESNVGIPVSVAAGNIGKLWMKIPWASLFRSPIEVTIQDLYVLLKPSYATYDHETEERIATVYKKNLLNRLEGRYKDFLINQSKQHQAQSTSYTEHYGIQIARNMQLKVESVHIRYEDSVLLPSQPFTCGIMIKSVRVQTTDENWKPMYMSQHPETTCKLGTVEGLGIYWNRTNEFISTISTTSAIQILQVLKDIGTEASKFQPLTCLIGPLQLELKCTLTPRPQRTDFQRPILSLALTVNEISSGMSHEQMHDMLHVAEIFEFIARKQKYKKFKTQGLLEYRGHYLQWWKFAQAGVLDDVRRRRQNWDWNHIKGHCGLLRYYTQSYTKKLASLKHPNPELESTLEEMEKELDIFNIILARQVAHVYHARFDKVVTTKKSSWSFTNWFNPSATPDETTRVIKEPWTSEEKILVHQALDFDHHHIKVDYPPDYESYKIHFHIQELTFVATEVLDHSDGAERVLVKLKATEFESSLVLRPVNEGLILHVMLGTLDVRGLMDRPHMITSKKVRLNSAIFEFMLENRPLHSPVGRRLHVVAQPLQVLYHYKTVQRLLDLFAGRPQVELHELRAVASNLLESEDVIASNLRDLVKNRDEIDLTVELYAPYILIPHGGHLRRNSNVLVIDLGVLNMHSLPRVLNSSNTTLPSYTYDKFNLELSDFQIFLALPGENYGEKPLRKANYLLRYQKMSMKVKHLLSGPYKHLPGWSVEVDLPILDVDISQHRFIQFIKVLFNLPTPSVDSASVYSTPQLSTATLSTAESSRMSITPDLTSFSELEVEKSYRFKGVKVLTDVAVSVHIYTVKIALSQGTGKKLIVEFLGGSVFAKVKTYSTEVESTILGMTFSLVGHQVPGATSETLFVINVTDDMPTREFAKFTMHKVSKSCPRKYLPPVGTFVTLKISYVDIMCHQEALAAIINFIVGFIRSDAMSMGTSPTSGNVPVKPSRAKIQTKVVITLEGTQVTLAREMKPFAKILLNNLCFSLESTLWYDSMKLRVEGMKISPMNPTLAYQTILLVEGATAVDFIVVMYSPSSMSANYTGPDLVIEVITGSPFALLLPSFVTDLKSFIVHVIHFQDDSTGMSKPLKRDKTSDRGPMRMSLFIKLESPRFALLDDDSSPDAILINLGKISIQNQLKITREKGSGIVSGDEIRFALDDAKVSRIFIDFSRQVTTAEVYLLNPISLRFELSRNFFPDDDSTPAIALTVNVEDNVIRLDTRDYEILKKAFQVLCKNSSTQEQQQQQLSTTTRPSHIQTDEANRVSLNAQANLQRLELVLYSQVLILAGAEGVVERDDAHMLAEFSLHKLQAKLTLWRNADIMATLTVADVTLKDVLNVPQQSGRRVLIQRDHNESRPSFLKGKVPQKYMLKIEFKKGTIRNPHEPNVHMDLPPLSVSASSEFLVELIAFFSS